MSPTKRPSVQTQVTEVTGVTQPVPVSDQSAASIDLGLASGYHGKAASKSLGNRPFSSGGTATVTHNLSTTSEAEISAFQRSAEISEPKPSEMRDDISSISSSISLAASQSGTNLTDSAFLAASSKRVRVPDFLQHPHVIVSASSMSPSSLRAAKSSSIAVTYSSPRTVLPISQAIKQEQRNAVPPMSSDLTRRGVCLCFCTKILCEVSSLS